MESDASSPATKSKTNTFKIREDGIGQDRLFT